MEFEQYADEHAHWKKVSGLVDIVLLPRYEDLVFGTPSYLPEAALCADFTAETQGNGSLAAALGRGKHRKIKRLRVYVGSYDQSLNLQTDESYALSISAPTSTLQVRSHLACWAPPP